MKKRIAGLFLAFALSQTLQTAAMLMRFRKSV